MMLLFISVGFLLVTSCPAIVAESASFYSLSAHSVNGSLVSLREYSGKVKYSYINCS